MEPEKKVLGENGGRTSLNLGIRKETRWRACKSYAESSGSAEGNWKDGADRKTKREKKKEGEF